jgi:hypothetical protein
MPGKAGQSAVDHHPDILDGHRAFRDVGGEDDLAAIGRADGAVLFFRGLVAVERQESPAVTAGKGGAGRLRAPDLVCAWEEHENVAWSIADTL